MNFFQELFELTDGIDVNIKVKRKNGKLTLSVLPETTAVLIPALITGTPEELEEGFFAAIKAPIETAKGLKADLESFSKSAANAKPREQVKSEEKKEPKKEVEKPKKEPTVEKLPEPNLFE